MTSQPHACALVTLRPHDGDGWPRVIVPMLRWLAQSEPSLLPEHRMTLLLESQLLDLAEDEVAITITHLADSAGTMMEWALRYRAPDPTFAPRRWQTDIGLIRDAACWHVSALLSYSLAPGYIGQNAPPPTPSAPTIIASLLASKEWSIQPCGDLIPAVTPHLLHVGTSRRFIAALTDATRQLPLVYLSQTAHSGIMCDADQLARALAGAAVTVVSAAPTLDRELSNLLPKWLHCFGGAVRIYLPDLRLDNERDALRHRFLLPADLALMSPDAIVQTVTRGVLSWNLSTAPTRHLTVDDVQLHALKQRLDTLRSAADRDGNELRAYVALLEHEHSHLTTQVTALTAQSQQATANYASLQAATDQEIGRLSRELARLRQEGGGQASESSSVRTEPDLDALRELPDDLLAMLNIICLLFPTRLRVTERAHKSAQAAAINHTRDIRGAWRLLYALATTMYDLVFAESPAGDLPRRFGDLTGVEFALTEGRQTKNDERMMAKRRDTDDQGAEIDITPHLKLGNRSPNILRIHFATDRNRRLLIIGHCGDHLDTFGTQGVK